MWRKYSFWCLCVFYIFYKKIKNDDEISVEKILVLLSLRFYIFLFKT